MTATIDGAGLAPGLRREITPGGDRTYYIAAGHLGPIVLETMAGRVPVSVVFHSRYPWHDRDRPSRCGLPCRGRCYRSHGTLVTFTNLWARARLDEDAIWRQLDQRYALWAQSTARSTS
jgi:hypothetical protein